MTATKKTAGQLNKGDVFIVRKGGAPFTFQKTFGVNLSLSSNHLVSRGGRYYNFVMKHDLPVTVIGYNK